MQSFPSPLPHCPTACTSPKPPTLTPTPNPTSTSFRAGCNFCSAVSCTTQQAKSRNRTKAAQCEGAGRRGGRVKEPSQQTHTHTHTHTLSLSLSLDLSRPLSLSLSLSLKRFASQTFSRNAFFNAVSSVDDIVTFTASTSLCCVTAGRRMSCTAPSMRSPRTRAWRQ